MNHLTISWLAAICAAAVLLPYFNRLLVMNWRTHLWRVVGMHLSWALWLGWVAWRGALTHDVDARELLGIGGAALWLLVSRPTWRTGPPEYTESDKAPLATRPMGDLHDHAR